MKKIIIPLIIIILLALIVSRVLYQVIYKLPIHKGEPSQPRTDSQQTVTSPKSVTKLDPSTEFTAVVPVISNEFATKATNPSEPSDVHWSVLVEQLRQLEESRQVTAKALMDKAKPPAEVPKSE
ncbi:MAG: hypothetical protein BWK79_11555 [Beggiatoa sp. IS2]|nr:MAG: hypothetical protein BWK79_11555 [Beggiatoa sp. IS2]